ncbi:hypothetical protein P879_08795 [Paragonimus westermani]|uniref:Glutathione peroxidase n=1 Tax=Paragonimus westermani TaxID=34504 RepID=A0A8T0DC52_9TREM|nr:hypothetical protein P879_08795 [Paragonimus westermani]
MFPVNVHLLSNLVCLIVNVASNCALVDVMYQQLQALYDQYAANGLRILAFPCNQFFNMEPGTDEEIKRHVTAKYNVTFDLFHKIDVNGNETIPLYRYLKEKQPGYLPNGQIEYNFVKFLVGRDGIPRERHPPTTPPVPNRDADSIASKTSIYDFNATDIDGNLVNLSKYRLLGQHNRSSLIDIILKEPGTDEEIKQHVTDKYNITFHLFHKIDVNGDHTIPLYRYLKKKLPGYQPNGAIEYNYVKFLIDRKGIPRERFPSSTPPMKMEKSIQRMLSQ